jgi:hypothetical protein
MRFRAAAYVACLLCTTLFWPRISSAQPPQKSATVPAVIDHNRVIIDIDLTLPDGTTQKTRAWVDNGNPELEMSRHLATMLGLPVACGEQECTAPPPHEIGIGGMAIPLDSIKEVHIPLRPVTAASVLEPGMNAEITVPSTILRHYDVLIDYPGKKFSIGPPGSIQFHGSSSKVQINAENGLIEVPSEVPNELPKEIRKKKLTMALDMGSSISFLSDDLFSALATAHPDWPHLTGAVGSANMWGLADEPQWKLMRLDRLHYGPLFLTDVPVADFPKDRIDHFAKRAGVATAGLIGGDVFLNYRVGLDYAHSTVYFELGTFTKFPDFDVVGLVLRPADDGRFTILGVVEDASEPPPIGVRAGDSLIAVDGLPVRGATLGQVWAMLGGTPGQERKLTIEREGKQFVVAATVRHFLPEVPDESDARRKKK